MIMIVTQSWINITYDHKGSYFLVLFIIITPGDFNRRKQLDKGLDLYIIKVSTWLIFYFCRSSIVFPEVVSIEWAILPFHVG
jgi:hypothetical protein